MLEQDLDGDTVTNLLHLLKFKSYVIIDCSEVPFSGNSFHIETDHLHCKLTCWSLCQGGFAGKFFQIESSLALPGNLPSGGYTNNYTCNPVVLNVPMWWMTWRKVGRERYLMEAGDSYQ